MIPPSNFCPITSKRIAQLIAEHPLVPKDTVAGGNYFSTSKVMLRNSASTKVWPVKAVLTTIHYDDRGKKTTAVPYFSINYLEAYITGGRSLAHRSQFSVSDPEYIIECLESLSDSEWADLMYRSKDILSVRVFTQKAVRLTKDHTYNRWTRMNRGDFDFLDKFFSHKHGENDDIVHNTIDFIPLGPVREPGDSYWTRTIGYLF